MLKILKPMLAILILSLGIKPALAQLPDDLKGETEQQGNQLPDDFRGDVEQRIIHTPNAGLDIDVWINKAEGSTYYPGEDIKVYFRASRDCYVVVYDLDTRGYVNVLYPYSPEDDRYVQGGRVYGVPGRYDDYSLTVDGPSGVEYIQAVASYEPLSPGHWSDYYRGEGDPGDISTLRMDENEDPYVFMEWVNHRISPYPDYVTDVTDLYVRYQHPRWYYHPNLYQYYPYSYPYDLGSVYIWAPFAVDVYIDGIFFGIAPLTIPSFVCGRHFVTYYYHGCRIWDNYFTVESGRTVRIDAKLNQHIRYVREDPVKKEYRSWKEKEYRLVQERRSESMPEKIRRQSGFPGDRSSVQSREGKSARTGEPAKQPIEGYRSDYQNRNGAKDQIREFAPEKQDRGQKPSRPAELEPQRAPVKERQFRESTPQRIMDKQRQTRSERQFQDRPSPAPREDRFSRPEPRKQEVRAERSNRAPEGRAEVRANRGAEGRTQVKADRGGRKR